MTNILDEIRQRYIEQMGQTMDKFMRQSLRPRPLLPQHLTTLAPDPSLTVEEIAEAYQELKAEADKQFPPTWFIYHPDTYADPQWRTRIDALRSRPNSYFQETVHVREGVVVTCPYMEIKITP
jgi:hypothetical protein